MRGHNRRLPKTEKSCADVDAVLWRERRDARGGEGANFAFFGELNDGMRKGKDFFHSIIFTFYYARRLL